MVAKFEVGKEYYAYDSGLDPVKVVKRTAKTVVMEYAPDRQHRMLIRHYENGDEYVRDYHVPAMYDDFEITARLECTD